MNVPEEKNYSSLASHKVENKTAKPPMMQLDGMSPRSWKDDRLPDLLWAVVLRCNLGRDECLSLFREVSEMAESKVELFDITHSGMFHWSKEDRAIFFKKITAHSPDAINFLKQLTYFKTLPNRNEWVDYFGEPAIDEFDFQFIAKSIYECFDHQSQEATDCRWLKVLCLVKSGKIKMLPGMDEKIIGYPNVGDMRSVRPLIRATEIMPFVKDKQEWSEEFWEEAMESTLCVSVPRESQKLDTIKINHESVARARHLLVLHYMATDKTSSIDPIHDSLFGSCLYSLRLLDEIVATNLSRGAIGRIVLRTLVENYITLSYLISIDSSSVWESFRNYGVGQMKQAFIKINESTEVPSYFDTDYIRILANEDRWIEFTNIELGDWGKSDLRKRAVDAGLKDVYDKYYDWTSGYSHGSWGAIRESTFRLCGNPLHKFHSMPDRNVYQLPGILSDAVSIVNKTLELVETKYPGLGVKIEDVSNIVKIPVWKQIWNRLRYRKEQKDFDELMGL